MQKSCEHINKVIVAEEFYLRVMKKKILLRLRLHLFSLKSQIFSYKKIFDVIGLNEILDFFPIVHKTFILFLFQFT